MFEDFIHWLVGAPPSEDEEDRAPADEDGDPASDDNPGEEEVAVSESPPEAAEPDVSDDEAPTVEDLEYRIDELETEFDRVENSAQATRRGQQDVTESVEELEATVRQLMGVYDQLTNDANPFAADDSFGVVGGGASADPVDDGDALAEASATAPVSNGTTPADSNGAEPSDDEHGPGGEVTSDPTAEPDDGADGVVSFEDLKSATAPEDDPAGSDEATGDRDGRERDGREGDDHHPDGVDAPATPTPESDEDVLLDSLAQGYAVDVVVFEWLSTLVADASPAGALKALDYYETIGWISTDVRDQLEATLGGPTIDGDVDPSAPRDLTARQHGESYDYVLTLRTLGEMDAEGALARE